jgi:osmoprotectant transport system permease protein
MGATNFQMLWRVELPMAFPVIMSGIRTVAVLTVGTTTMAALVGAGGLGELVFQGISMMDNRLTMAGAIPIAMMAVILDQCLGLIERRLQKLTGVVDQVV